VGGTLGEVIIKQKYIEVSLLAYYLYQIDYYIFIIGGEQVPKMSMVASTSNKIKFIMGAICLQCIVETYTETQVHTHCK